MENGLEWWKVAQVEMAKTQTLICPTLEALSIFVRLFSKTLCLKNKNSQICVTGLQSQLVGDQELKVGLQKTTHNNKIKSKEVPGY